MKIVEQIWKGVMIACDCGKSFHVTIYHPTVQCPRCAHVGSTASLLATWFGIDRGKTKRALEEIAAQLALSHGLSNPVFARD